jgi:alginate O-acetyltransferase complex protein AlgI
LLGYLLAPKALRNACLLVASLLFYAWGEPYLVVVMLATILVNFASGLYIGDGLKWGPIAPLPVDGPRTRQQKFFLGVAIGVNLFLLGVFKYFNFGLHSFYALLGVLVLRYRKKVWRWKLLFPWA